jgi:peptidoglycan/LPS O-acetylase OafA/YrhL
MGILSVLTFFVRSGYVIALNVNRTIKTSKFSFYTYFTKLFFSIFPVAWCSAIYISLIVLIIYIYNLPYLSHSVYVFSGDKYSQANFLSINNLLYSISHPPVGCQGGWFNLPFWTLSLESCIYMPFGVYVQSKQDSCLVLYILILKHHIIMIFIPILPPLVICQIQFL